MFWSLTGWAAIEVELSMLSGGPDMPSVAPLASSLYGCRTVTPLGSRVILSNKPPVNSPRGPPKPLP
jgi:hypothetical protein